MKQKINKQYFCHLHEYKETSASKLKDLGQDVDGSVLLANHG